MRKSATASHVEATFRTHLSSVQATSIFLLHHLELIACYSRAALEYQ